ncbi:hypothetical protein [Chitinimonas koreensis]|uniref:hypothetical protein n=1 Tax=Chitinimonas koreensis TaxID=356302 RepID=UPI0012F88FEC|nr:hypothetical protein [Chitinimonas koreensis]QNM97607.1 hypothetical protein H9L41_04720 [Chitinimonas koreensis]
MHIGNIDRLINIINWVSLFLVGLYFFSMFIYPWFHGGERVHAVWFDWQSLNVGILAYASSLIIFGISRYHANQQRRREFIAARSFLPAALSELADYLEQCASVLVNAYEVATNRELGSEGVWGGMSAPDIGGQYREIFSRCISHADSEPAEYLSNILVRLQVHQSRIAKLVRDIQPGGYTVVTSRLIMSYIFGLGELRALVNGTFEYARGGERFPVRSLGWEDYLKAYLSLGVHFETIDGLEEFTKHRSGGV